MTLEHDEAARDDAAPEEPAPPRRLPGCSAGCLSRALAVIVVAVALVIVIGEVFDQGKKAGAPQGFTLPGPAEEYARGDVNQFEPEHLFVVRLPDGEFLALYDKSAKRQQFGGGCRIEYDETALPGRLDQVPGMTGAFVEECEDTRAVWRVDGTFATGNNFGDMDRFATHLTDDGRLFVDTSERTCTRSTAGAAPFEQTTCSGAP